MLLKAVSKRITEDLHVDGLAQVELRPSVAGYGNDVHVTFKTKAAADAVADPVEVFVSHLIDYLPLVNLYVEVEGYPKVRQYSAERVIELFGLETLQEKVDFMRDVNAIPQSVLKAQAELVSKGYGVWIIDYEGTYLSVELPPGHEPVQGSAANLVGTKAMLSIPDEDMRDKVIANFQRCVNTGQQNDYTYARTYTKPDGRWSKLVECVNTPYPEHRLVLSTTRKVLDCYLGVELPLTI